MNAKFLRAAFACATLPLFTQTAFAHASLEQPTAAPGSTYKAVLRIPHGCDGTPTTKVQITIPEGYFNVKPMPHAGWDLTTTKADYSKTYEAHGHPYASGVVTITFSNGNLRDDWYDEFTFRGSLAPDLADGTTLYFPTVQTCVTGQNLWTEQNPDAGGKPAPKLKIVAEKTPMAGMDHSTGMDQSADMANMASGNESAAKGGSATLGDLSLAGAYVRATAPNAPTGGGYVTITNKGDQADRLVSIATNVSDKAEIHQMSMKDNVMIMSPLPDGIEIPAHGEVTLKPGGMHLMFMGLHAPFDPGQSVTVTFKFAHSGDVTVNLPVFKQGEMPGMNH